MRLVSLFLSFLVTVSLTAVALAYVPDYVGQQRIYVGGQQDTTLVYQPYHGYGDSGTTNQDSARATTGASDPYHQRYYSDSEGWTYYTLVSEK